MSGRRGGAVDRENRILKVLTESNYPMSKREIMLAASNGDTGSAQCWQGDLRNLVGIKGITREGKGKNTKYKIVNTPLQSKVLTVEEIHIRELQERVRELKEENRILQNKDKTSRAMDFAGAAIGQLGRVEIEDPQFLLALTAVRNYINKLEKEYLTKKGIQND